MRTGAAALFRPGCRRRSAASGGTTDVPPFCNPPAAALACMVLWVLGMRKLSRPVVEEAAAKRVAEQEAAKAAADAKRDAGKKEGAAAQPAEAPASKTKEAAVRRRR